MSYDAIERGRDLIVAAVNASLSTYITSAATDHGVTDPGAPRAVYTSIEARPMYPHVEVMLPRGTLVSLTRGEIQTEAEYWVIGSISGALPSETDAAASVYLTALIRLFASSGFSNGDGSYLAEPVEFDFSPPVFETDTTQKRSVGVLVRFTFAEAV